MRKKFTVWRYNRDSMLAAEENGSISSWSELRRVVDASCTLSTRIGPASLFQVNRRRRYFFVSVSAICTVVSHPPPVAYLANLQNILVIYASPSPPSPITKVLWILIKFISNKNTFKIRDKKNFFTVIILIVINKIEMKSNGESCSIVRMKNKNW